MIVLLALDDRNGMGFNRRRQSRDRALSERVLALAAGRTLWMAPYSAPLFAGAAQGRLRVEEDFLALAPPGDFCWVEDRPLAPWAGRIERLICYRWNRRYPGDFFLDLPLDQWRRIGCRDFPGFSHKMITEEVYEP